MKKNNVIILALSLLMLAGCAASNKELYYWGNYSSTLYAYTKEPSVKTMAAHHKELLNIITKSTKQRKAVPPGIYAELGHMSLKKGETTQANAYFQKELTLYPEASILINSELQKNSK